MKQTKKIKDIKGVISKQKRYATLAKKEGQYAKKREKIERKAGNTEQAKDSAHEAMWGFKFSKERKKIVVKEKSKLTRIKK